MKARMLDGFEILIFDHCGTLVDNLYQTYQTAMFIFEKLGIKRITLEEFKRESELPYMNFYRKFTDAPKKEIDRLFVEGSRALETEIKVSLFPVIEDMLNFLDMEGVKMAVLSSLMEKSVKLNLRRLSIEKYFFKVIGDVDNKANGLRVFLKQYNIDPKKAVYMGDMGYDITAGKEAGLGMTVAVLWGFDSREKLEKAEPDFLLESPADIWRLFI